MSPPFLRQDTLFHDPDSFRFTQEFTFFKTNIMELDFFKLHYIYLSCRPRIANLHTLFKASRKKETIFNTLNSDCLPFTWANRSGKMAGKIQT